MENISALAALFGKPSPELEKTDLPGESPVWAARGLPFSTAARPLAGANEASVRREDEDLHSLLQLSHFGFAGETNSATVAPREDSHGFRPLANQDKGKVPPGSGHHQGRLEHLLNRLSPESNSYRRLLLVGRLLSRLDLEAFRDLLTQLEKLGEWFERATTPGASAESSEPSNSVFTQNLFSPPPLQLDALALCLLLSKTRGNAEGDQLVTGQQRGPGAGYELRLKGLQIFLSRLELQPEDPQELQADPDHRRLVPTVRGMVLNVKGTGQPTRATLVPEDELLTFCDPNGNHMLDGMLLAQSLEDLGLSELSALCHSDKAAGGAGLHRVARSHFAGDDGTQGTIFEYLFEYRPF